MPTSSTMPASVTIAAEICRPRLRLPVWTLIHPSIAGVIAAAIDPMAVTMAMPPALARSDR